jgi:hypothetical protein
MNSLHIGLGPWPGPATAADAFAATTIILAKALAFDDYRSPYSGAELSLIGVCAEEARAERAFSRRLLRTADPFLLVGRDPRDRNRRILDLSDRFASSPGGCGSLEEAFDLLALARLNRFSDPLAFLASSDPRRRLEAFLARLEREGHLPPERLALPVVEAEILAAREVSSPPRRPAARSAYLR